MITIISGTNRKDSLTKKVAEEYQNILSEITNEEIKLLSLESLPENFVHKLMYEEDHQNLELGELQDQYFVPADKLVFIVPEYNGSYPGIFKLFIDAISVRKYKENFENKKVGLIGVASGRGGNLRGLDHLTTSLNYLKMFIHHNRLPISGIENKLDNDGSLSDLNVKQDLHKHAVDISTF